MLASHRSSINELVAFEAVNVLGGIEKATLAVNDVFERDRLIEKAKAVTSSIEDREVREHMTRRALPSINAGRLDVLSSMDASAMEAAFRSLIAQQLRSWHKKLGKQLEHTAATLRAFAESQLHPTLCLGTAAIRVFGDTKRAFGSAFGTIDRCLQMLTEFLGGKVRPAYVQGNPSRVPARTFHQLRRVFLPAARHSAITSSITLATSS